MGLRSFCALTLLALNSLGAIEGSSHALYLMQQNRVEEAITRYRETAHTIGRHDFDVLQQMGFILLQKGSQSPDPQTFLMTLFGAGFSGSTRSLEILARGIDHPDPQVQIFALHFISQFSDDISNDLLNQAMSSDYLATRMEAAFYLAQRKHPHAVGQIEGLMFRLPPQFKPYFPSLFALLGTNEGTLSLKRLIEDPDPQVRVESILQVARLGRDDFLPALRKRLTHSHVAELEATAYAMGLFKDNHSLPRLKKLTQTSSDTVRLSAGIALIELGDRSFVPSLGQMAKEGNLFAIASLGPIAETDETLAGLVSSKDLQIRLNAAVALLHKRDPRCFEALSEWLVRDSRDLAFHPFVSVGRSLLAWKAVPSAELRAKDPTIDLSYSQVIREQLLRESIHLPQETFLQLARKIFAKQQNDLVPSLIALLENLQTPEAIALLQEGANKFSAPLIRDYCNLALYRIKQEGPYEEHVNQWVMQQKHADLIQLRPPLPWKYRLDTANYELTAEETSRLLIETVLAIAGRRDEKSISFLLEAIQKGNPQNRYALMGLLMKATE
jgi:HEAT repeat protein